MARKTELEAALSALTDAPWWLSVVLSTVVYLGLSVVLPAAVEDGPIIRLVSGLAVPFAALLLLLAAISAFRSWRSRRMLAEHQRIEDIRGLDWKEFEELVAAHYRKLGFHVRWEPGDGPDGGVDVRLKGRGGETYLVQCKQWQERSVGVKVVRELFGIVAAERAAGGVVITTGSFTEDARQFACGLAMELIDGMRLEAMMRGQPKLASEPQGESVGDDATNAAECPRCGAALVLRKARRGPKAGMAFYGCSTYPACRYTRST